MEPGYWLIPPEDRQALLEAAHVHALASDALRRAKMAQESEENRNHWLCKLAEAQTRRGNP